MMKVSPLLFRTYLLVLGVFVLLPTVPVQAGEEEVIRDKIRALRDKSRSEDERANAAAELGAYGPKAKAAVPALVEALAVEPFLQKKAAVALAKIGKPAVPLLIEALDSDNPQMLAGAVEALDRIGPDARAAAPRLVQLLGAEEAPNRIAVAGALGSLRDPASVTFLAERVRSDPDFGVRRYAAYALQRFGADAKAAVPALLDALRQANALSKLEVRPKVRDSSPPFAPGVFVTGDPVVNLDLAASNTLSAIGEPAVPGVVALLGSTDKDLRRDALSILGGMGGKAKAAVPAVAKSLEDKDPQVREDAASALAYIGREAAAAVPALRKTFRDPLPRVRILAAVAVMQIDSQADGALDVVQEGLRHKDAEVRLLAVSELGALKPSTRPAVTALASATKDSDAKVRESAVIWLGVTGRPAEVVVPALEAALKDDSEEVRYQAARYLGDVEGGEKAIPALIRALRDSSAGVRKMAALGLAHHAKYAADAVPALENVRQDPDEEVRKLAADALRKIKELNKET